MGETIILLIEEKTTSKHRINSIELPTITQDNNLNSRVHNKKITNHRDTKL